MDGTETPPHCAWGCRGGHPMADGGPCASLQRGCQLGGTEGVTPCGLGAQWVFWGDVTPPVESCPHMWGVNGGHQPSPGLWGVSNPRGMGWRWIWGPHSAPHTSSCSRHKCHFLLPFSTLPRGPTFPRSWGAPSAPQPRLPMDCGGPSRPPTGSRAPSCGREAWQGFTGIMEPSDKALGGSEGINFIFTLAAAGGGGGPSLGSVPLSRTPQQTPLECWWS